MQTRSFASNAVLTAVGWAVPTAAALVAVPITVRGLGANQYGLLAFVAALTGYLSIMDMGLGQAIVRYLAYYRSLDQGRPMRQILRVALIWFGAAGVLGALLLLTQAPFIVQHLVTVPQALESLAITVVRLAGVSFFLGMFVSVGAAIPQAFLRYDLSAAMSAGLGTASAVGPAVLVALGYGLVPVVIYSILINAVAIVCYGAIALLLMRSVTRDTGPTWREIRRPVLRFAGITALTRVHYVLAMQTNRLVVGFTGGVADLAYYQVPNLLSTKVADMLSRVGQIILPTGAHLFAEDNLEGTRTLYVRTSRVFFLVNASVTAGVCAFAAPLLRTWVGPQYAAFGAWALVFFSLAQCMNTATMSASNLNMAYEKPGINLVFSLANSVVNLVVVYPLALRFGVTGAALAALLGSFAVPPFFLYTHRAVLKVSSWSVLRRCYLPSLGGSVIIGISAFYLVAPLCRTLPTTLALCVATISAALGLSALLGAVKREDVETVRRLAGAWLRRG